MPTQKLGSTTEKPPEKPPEKIGTWRLSNHRFTFLVRVNASGKVIDAAPIAARFIGKSLEEVCCWMQRMGKTDIMLMRSRRELPIRSLSNTPKVS